MTSSRFVQSVAANLAFWRDHEGLADPRAWSALDRERENLFRATVSGLQLDETYPEAAELVLECFTYVFERGYWPEWTPVLEQAISGCPGDQLALMGRLLNQSGSLYRRQRRLDEALAAHEQAEKIGRQLDDQSLIARTNLRLGRVFLRQRSYAEAERYAQLALAEYETGAAAPQTMASAYNLLGIIAQGRGDYDASERYLRQACELFRQAKTPIELGRSLVNLCNTMESQGLTAETLGWFEEAAAIFTTYDLQIEYARLFNALGTLHYKQGGLAEAEAAFRKADTPIMRRSGPVYFQSLTEMNLGNVLLNRGRFEESRAYFLKCVAGFRQVNALTRLANSLDGLAETSIELGDREEAIGLYEEALDIVTAIPEDAFANRMEKRFRGILRELRHPTEEEE